MLPRQLYAGDDRIKTFLLPVSRPVRLTGAEIDIVASRKF